MIKQNISFGLRTLLKNKGFTITAVLTLALGIGATTAIFSVVYAVFEPMPYPNPDQLVMVWARMPRRKKLRAGRRFSRMATTQHLVSGNGRMGGRLVQRRH